MKAKLFALALAATAFGIVTANAQTVIVKEKTPDVVVKERVVVPTPGVTVTTGSGVSDCSTKKVVRKNELTDSKTTKTVKRCD